MIKMCYQGEEVTPYVFKPIYFPNNEGGRRMKNFTNQDESGVISSVSLISFLIIIHNTSSDVNITERVTGAGIIPRDEITHITAREC